MDYRGEKNITPYKDSTQGKKEQVRGMFNKISENYDSINRVMTLTMDISWRKNVVEKVREISPDCVLDVATGTADLAIELSEIKNAKIVGIDISQGMLEVGKQKIEKKNLKEKITLEIGDCEDLRFEDESFDAATVAYGVRNFENLEKGLSEIKRVLKNGGRLVVLETSVPENHILKAGYWAYTKYIVPAIGKIMSKDKGAYRYLSESANRFPCGRKFAEILKEVGFSWVAYYPQTLGVTTIYVADK